MKDVRPGVRLILVRHGETPCNTDKVWHGWHECDLTDNGLAHAKAVGKRLAAERISAIYCSPARRALQTAAFIAAPRRLALIPDPGLRERSVGELEGLPASDVVRRHPTILRDRAADYWHWQPPGGESYADVLRRSLLVVERIRRAHGGETIALVTHVGPVRVLLSHLANVPPEKTYEVPFPSTGVTILAIENGRAEIEALNDATHLSPAPEQDQRT